MDQTKRVRYLEYAKDHDRLDLLQQEVDVADHPEGAAESISSALWLACRKGSEHYLLS